MDNWFEIGDRRVRREIWPCAQARAGPGDIKAVAPLGSMLAVVSSELGSERDEDAVKCVLRIYNGACALVTSVKWYVRFDNILAVHWTDQLELAAVFTNGCVRVYSAHGELLRSFYLPPYGGKHPGRMEPGLIKHRMWADGLVLVNFENQRLFFQRGFEGPNSWIVELGDFALTVTALGVVPSRAWSEVLVVVSTTAGTSYVKMDHLTKCTAPDDFHKYLLQINPSTYTQISCSPYHFPAGNAGAEAEADARKFVGLGNSEDGLLTSLSINERSVRILWEIKLEEPFGEVHTLDDGMLAVTLSANKADSESPAGTHPRDAETTVIRLIHNAVYNINIHTHAAAVLSDVGGGLRIFARGQVEYVELVAASSELALSGERCDAANSLLRTFEMFKKGHEKSSESLYAIRDKLPTAAATCLDAARDQWDFDTALLLVEVAIFANSMAPFAPASGENGANGRAAQQPKPVSLNGLGELEGTVDEAMARAGANEPGGTSREHVLVVCFLRLCRNLAQHNVLTNVNQLMRLGLRRLITLLTNMKLYLLSIRICEFFRINPTEVLLGWITTRIRLGAHLTDAELLSAITQRLDRYLGTVLTFAKVAQVVFKQKREALALSFAELEKCPYSQFRVLVRWNELGRAARVANECGDPTLINYIVLRNVHDVANVLALARNYGLVKSMFLHQLVLAGNDKLLQVFYERANDVFEAGLNSVGLYTSLGPPAPPERDRRDPRDREARDQRALEERRQALLYSNGYFGGRGTAEAAFWHEAVNTELLLLEQQAQLERAHEPARAARLVGRSLMETLFELYRLGLAKEADALAALFKLPATQARCTRIAALYEANNVPELVGMLQDKQLAGAFVRGGRTFLHLILQALVGLGANAQVDAVIHAMKPAQQGYWRQFINQQGAG